MKTRSLFGGMAIAIMFGMIFAGGVTIADGSAIIRFTERQEHKQYGGTERHQHRSVLEYYQKMWFHTTFVLQLEDAILVRARDVYSRALHDIHGAKNAEDVTNRFKTQLRKTIGDENYKKLKKSTDDSRTRFFSRKNIKIGEQGRNRRRGKFRKENLNHHNKDSDKKFKPRTKTDLKHHLGVDKLPRIPN